MQSPSPKLTLVYRTHRAWLGNPAPDHQIRNLNDRVVHFLTGQGDYPARVLDVLRGAPADFPEVASKDSLYEVSGCKHVTWVSLTELDELLSRDAKTGERKITSGMSYREYLGEEFAKAIQWLRVQAVERIIVGFN